MEDNKALSIIEEFCDYKSYERRLSNLDITNYSYKSYMSFKEMKYVDNSFKSLEKHIKMINKIKELINIYQMVVIEKEICENLLSALNDFNINKEYKKYKQGLNTFIIELESFEKEMLKKLKKMLEKDSDKIILINESGVKSLYERITMNYSFDMFVLELGKEIKNSIKEICSLKEGIEKSEMTRCFYSDESLIKQAEEYVLGYVENLSLIFKTSIKLDKTQIKKIQYLFYQILETCSTYNYLKKLSDYMNLKLSSKEIVLTPKCLVICNELKKLSYAYNREIITLMNKVNCLLLKNKLNDLFKSINIIKYNQMNISKFENILYINNEDRLKLENDKQEIIDVLKKYPEFSELIYLEDLISKNKQYMK